VGCFGPGGDNVAKPGAARAKAPRLGGSALERGVRPHCPRLALSLQRLGDVAGYDKR
jgi:hypothetical protein